MRTLRGPFWTWKSFHRTVSTSDVPTVARRHARVGIRVRPMRCPSSMRRPCGQWSRRGVDLRARGPCVAFPVRVRRARARERLPSYREPASRNPQVMREETFGSPHARAPFRRLSIRTPRQAVLRTSSWLAPPLANRPCGLPGRRRAMRPTDVCHSIELRAPAPRVFPARSRRFRGGETPRRIRLRTVLPGDRTFHDVQGPLRRADMKRDSRSLLPRGLEIGAWAFSSHGAHEDRASDTPVANDLVHPHASSTFVDAALWPYVPLWKGWYGSEDAADRQDHRGRRLVKADAS